MAEAGPRDELARLGGLADAKIDLAEAAFALADAFEGGRDRAPYRRHLEALAAEVAAYAARPPGDDSGALALRAEAFREVLAKRYGYGREADFGEAVVEDADLMRVIDRRRGLPICVGILVLDVCRRLGWTAVPIDFPGRFLVRLEVGATRALLDAWGGGRTVGTPELRALLKSLSGADAELAPEHYRPMDKRAVLLRLLNNVKARMLNRNRPEDALMVLERMLLIAPEEAALWRESGLLNARLDRLKAAVSALEHHLRLKGGERSCSRTAALLTELRGRLI